MTKQTEAMTRLAEAIHADIAARASAASLSALNDRLELWASQGKPPEPAALPGMERRLADHIPGWVNAMEVEGKSRGTISLYKNYVASYLVLDERPTRASLDANLAAILRRTSAANTVSHEKALRHFFNHLEQHNLYQPNPTLGMRLTKQPHRHVKSPSSSQVEALLRAKFIRPADNSYFHTATILFVETGARLNEVLSIKQQDIDLDKRQITVIGKGDRQRTVFISPETAAMLVTFIAVYGQNSPWLFPSRLKGHAGHWGNGSYEHMTQKQCKRLGLGRITPHGLRHFFTTEMLRGGADLGKVSRLLGHSSIGVTDNVYRDVSQQELRDEQEKYSPLATLRQNGTPEKEGGNGL